MQAFRNDDFSRLDTFEACRQRIGRYFADPKFATGQIQPGQADALAVRADGHQQGVALVVEQGGVGQRAGRDDARDGAFDRPLAGGRVANLVANNDRFAEPDEAGQVLLKRVVGHAGHLDRHAGALAACGQRNIEQAGGFFGIFVEQFIEVAHPVEQQQVGMLRLDAEILAHHRRVV